MPPRAIVELLRRHDPAVRTLTLRLRNLVIAQIAPCHEYIYTMKWKIVFFYGATERVMNDGVCAISLFHKHVNLGFPRGVDLLDPDSVLSGTGVAWRHIAIRTPNDLQRPQIPVLLRQARDNAATDGATNRSEQPVVTRFKRPSATVAPRRTRG